ncbi:hypothetical protein F0U60_48605 [Archangium minus]|uniref:Immunity protein 52 domain-containing protein n=1 Tax=Archangium minus TaxID=83450 RepID=A0ABY9X6V1_9BACT|nr:hypothetical protein F0U60_48605 [Archangium minus]
MSESYLAGAYWGCRRESAGECARRAATFFRLLAECHPSYARWYEQASSPKRALELQFEPTEDSFVRFFGKKKYQSDGDGFHFSAWTGHDRQAGEGGMVMIHCGSDAEGAPNSVRLYFPKEPLGSEPMLTMSVAAGVMRVLAVAWEPDWAVVTSDDLWEQLSRHGEADTFVGWMTYISHNWGEVLPLTEPVRIEPVEGKGNLIILTPERLTATNTEHVALGHRIQRLLEERGLLREVGDRRQTPSA